MDNSPIRSIQNSSYAFRSNTSQQYQQQFWKLKAQRAEASAEQLKKQNQLLNKKVIEISRTQQDLREKVAVCSDQWKTISRRMTNQRTSEKYANIQVEDKNAASAQIERLIREIRILKNLHEGELTKVNDQNKGFRKQLVELESLKEVKRQNEQNLKIISKLNQEIGFLRRRLSSNEEQVAKLREEKGKIIGDCQLLRKELQQIKIKDRLAKKQEEDKLINYKQYCIDQNKLKLSRRDVATTPIRIDKQQYEEIAELQEHKEDDFDITLHEASVIQPDEIQQLKQQISMMQKKEKNTQAKLQLEIANHQNDQINSEMTTKKLQEELSVARGQLSNVLSKLAPLLSGKSTLSVSKENINIRASLSILQLFLQKYKIQAF